MIRINIGLLDNTINVTDTVVLYPPKKQSLRVSYTQEIDVSKVEKEKTAGRCIQ